MCCHLLVFLHNTPKKKINLQCVYNIFNKIFFSINIFFRESYIKYFSKKIFEIFLKFYMFNFFKNVYFILKIIFKSTVKETFNIFLDLLFVFCKKKKKLWNLLLHFEGDMSFSQSNFQASNTTLISLVYSISLKCKSFYYNQ